MIRLGEAGRNLLLTLRFHGGKFHGSAVQKNAVTVQGTLQDALERILGERPDVKCCSRTDAGVHAEMFCVSFRTAKGIPCERLCAALNAHFPEGAACTGCREVPWEFHARYSCAGKRYRYVIHNGSFRDPLRAGLCWEVPYPLDAGLLDREARDFLGTHDFRAFRASGGSVEDPVRTMTHSAVRRDGEWIFFEISGDGFLYHMVRIMTGTLLDIARGKIPSGGIPEILRCGERGKAGATVPPQGLYLMEVFYETGRTC